ncbi:MAG: NB-ARC domain-containing protein [Caldilineaceae bacterium]
MALKHWRGNRPFANALTELHITQQMARADSGNVRNAVKQLLYAVLTELEMEQARPVEIVRLHFLDGLKVVTIANQLNIAEITVHKDQKLAIIRMAECLLAREMAAREAHSTHLQQRLETATYSALVGVDEALAEIYALLAAPAPPWLISIVGMGGIGKTSLAHALASRAINAALFANVAWVTARQEQLTLGGRLQPAAKPALTADALIRELVVQLSDDDMLLTAMPTSQQWSFLQERLRTEPTLLILDNLETVADIEALLPTLQQLANPTKILLTSRQRYGAEAGSYHFLTPELSAANTLKLIRQEAALCNLPDLLQASDAELQPVFETVGGNPLAIRLVVGQIHVHSLDAILGDLIAARGDTTENLYMFIYRRAWNALDETARRIWLQMPLLVGRNANVQMLAKYTQYDVGAIHTALTKLANLNLIYVHGALNERYYSIHNLTKAFLIQGVVGWK